MNKDQIFCFSLFSPNIVMVILKNGSELGGV